MKMRGNRCEIDHEAPEINLLKKMRLRKLRLMPMSRDGPMQTAGNDSSMSATRGKADSLYSARVIPGLTPSRHSTTQGSSPRISVPLSTNFEPPSPKPLPVSGVSAARQMPPVTDRAQLQTAARLPCGGISEIAVNAALSMIEGAKPKDEVEAALIIQMACTHTAAMAVLSRIGGAHGGDRHVAMMAAATSKILRAFAVQVETLRRLRSGGSQYMRIEHIHVEPNAQAVIGNLQSRRTTDDE
jgi:hypothetical protein